jgi:hypothetical protein
MSRKDLVADEPISRILYGAALASLLRDDHSSSPGLATGIQRPTRGLILPCGLRCTKGKALFQTLSASRASSPLLFGLAPRGVFLASVIAAGAVGSYPTFSPLPASRSIRRPSGGFPSVGHRDTLRRRYILCGTFREQQHRLQPVIFSRRPLIRTNSKSYTNSSLCYRSPGVTRRVALHPQTSRPKGILCSRKGVSGLSSRPAAAQPSQRSSSSPANSIITRLLVRSVVVVACR